jgi:hypothetical protein
MAGAAVAAIVALELESDGEIEAGSPKSVN